MHAVSRRLARLRQVVGHLGRDPMGERKKDIVLKRAFLQSFLLLLIVLLPFQAGNCSLAYIKSSDLLGIYPDSVINPVMDSIVLAKIEQLRGAEIHEPFKCPPAVEQRFGFAEMPGIFLYSLNACSYISAGALRDPYEILLFGSTSTEIYRFMGQIESFNKIIYNSLPSNFNEYFVFDLLLLYLNSLSPTGQYYILKSYSDLENLYENDLHLSSGTTAKYPFLKGKIESDLKAAQKYVKDLCWSYNDGAYTYKFYCLNWGRKRLEKWAFRITEKGLSIEESEIVVEDLGVTP